MKTLLRVVVVVGAWGLFCLAGVAEAKKCPHKDLGGARQGALSRHNEFRAKHQNTPPMSLDNELNTEAQNCAEALAKAGKMDHALCNSQQVHQGENLFYGMSSAGPAAPDVAMVQAVNKWYDEIKKYDWSNPGYQPGTGHFTQVVWKTSTKLGMGYATKGNKYWVAGRYLEAGNLQGTYEKNVNKLK